MAPGAFSVLMMFISITSHIINRRVSRQKGSRWKKSTTNCPRRQRAAGNGPGISGKRECKIIWKNLCKSSWQEINFSHKNFDYPEKTLKYKHIRRISDWFYYQFTTFNGLRLDMPEHLASMKQPNTNATHWRRGTSAITQFHIAPHWRRYLIPTGKQGTPLFFYPHVTQ